MGCLGVLFSISKEEADALKAIENDSDLLEYLQNEIEERYFESEPARKVELDKAWDAIHRSLTDGCLGNDNGSFPLNAVILGGEALSSDDDYIMSLKTPEEVQQIAEALGKVGREQLRQAYFKIDEENYGFPVNEEDFDYTWQWFSGLKPFYNKAADEKRFVLFTADQ